MPKFARELKPLAVAKLKEPGLHFVGGVVGLALQVSASGARSWVYRYTSPTQQAINTETKQPKCDAQGRPIMARRDLGLGSFPTISLGDARELAGKAAALVKAGEDPIETAKARRSANRAAELSSITFARAAEKYVAVHGTGWRNPKHRAQWKSTIEQWANPIIGELLVRDIEKAHVMQVLMQPVEGETEPFWHARTETAKRLRGRMESVLSYADKVEDRERLNPARWGGHLDKLLPAPAKIAKVKHHRAVAIEDASDAWQLITQAEGMGARALQLQVLTAARSGEVRGAVWGEIDLQRAMWVLPPERMKSGKEHRVPLSKAAVSLLRTLPQGEAGELVFPSEAGGQLSDMTLAAVMKRLQLDAVPHGWRSTFRDWAGDRTHFPRDLIETALAHALDDKTEAAYRRGDALEKRRQLMEAWSKYLATPRAKPGSNVVPMGKRKAA